MIFAALLAVTAQQSLADWTSQRAPYGFDITPDLSIWINIAEPGRKDDFAVLADDLRRHEGQRWQEFWVRGYHLRNPEVRYRESKTRYRMDCEGRTITTVMRVTYDATGTLLWEWVAPSSGTFAYTPVVPGSLGARLFLFACPGN